MYIKIKNAYVTPLAMLLHAMELNVKASRMRTRFVKLLDEQESTIIYPEKKMILETYCTKDDEGKALMIDREKGIYLFEDPDDEEEAITALQELLSEELAIPLDEYNKDMILSVADTILNNEIIKVSGGLAEAVEAWVELFEYAIEFYESENKK